MQPTDDGRLVRDVPDADRQFLEVDRPTLRGLLKLIRAESPDRDIPLVLDDVSTRIRELARSRASARDPPDLSPGRTTTARSDRIALEESQVIDFDDFRLGDRSVLTSFEPSFGKLTVGIFNNYLNHPAVSLHRGRQSPATQARPSSGAPNAVSLPGGNVECEARPAALPPFDKRRPDVRTVV